MTLAAPRRAQGPSPDVEVSPELALVDPTLGGLHPDEDDSPRQSECDEELAHDELTAAYARLTAVASEVETAESSTRGTIAAAVGAGGLLVAVLSLLALLGPISTLVDRVAGRRVEPLTAQTPVAAHLIWPGGPAADAYHVEIFRGSIRVLAVDTDGPSLDVPPSSLRAGVYRWVVWPVAAGVQATHPIVESRLEISAFR
jgi:hypothetical protein